MGKLQQITRNNGSIVSSVNIPKDCIDELGWSKGDELVCSPVFGEEKELRVRKVSDGED